MPRLIKDNNQGFTLVELIVVTAIIAVFTAIAAPRYVKYVEESKVALDMELASTIKSAIITLCADGTITTDHDAYVTWDTETGLSGEGKDVVEAFTGVIPIAKSSKAKETNVVYSIDFTPEGTPIVTTNVDYTAWND